MTIAIRKYDPLHGDRVAVETLCCDAAFLGSSIDPIFRDRPWFANAMVGPYLLLEPEHTWVAEYDGHVAGYLTGSLTEGFGYARAYLLAVSVLIELIPRYVTGRYDAHPRSKRFAEFVITQGLSQIPKHPPSTPHFHFNVSAPYRRRGVGGRLLSAFEDTLRAKGMHRYYAEVMSSPSEKPERYFEALGYRIYDRVRTTIFEPEVTDLHVLCVVRNI